MIFGASKIKDLEQEWVGVRNCHLCGEEFTVGLYDTDTICPRCKELWKEFIKSKEMTVDWAEVFDILTTAPTEKG